MVGLIGLGLYYRKFAGQDLSNYFLGGRKLGGWINGISNAVTTMNADVAPAYCGMAVVTGLYVCWFYFSRFGLGIMAAALLFAIFWRRLRVSTSPEFYEVRYSGWPAITMRVLMSLRNGTVGVVFWMGAGLLALTKIAGPMLGWDKMETLAIAVPIILLYVFLAGYMGVVMSDLIQTIIMIASSITLMIMVWIDFGGPTGLYEALVTQFDATVVSWHPPPGDAQLGVVALIAWTFGACIGYGGDLSYDSQKLLSCRNTREASKMYIWTQITLFTMLALLTLPALGALAKWPGLYDGTINKEHAFSMLLGEYLPPGLLGLALIALIASLMSTIDSHMNFAGQVFVNDFYRRAIKPDASHRECMRVSRLFMCIIIQLAVLVAVSFENIIDISIFMLGLFGAELAANWAQWWWWRFNGAARIVASVGGPLIYWLNAKVIFADMVKADGSKAYVVILASIGATLVLWVLTTLLTKPDPRETLIAFYKQARPLGWWGPIAEAGGDPPVRWRPIATGFGIAGLGLVAISAGVLTVSTAYVGQWLAMTLAGVTCLGTAIAFRLTYTRFLAELDGDTP